MLQQARIRKECVFMNQDSLGKQRYGSAALAIASIPLQPWEEPYDGCKALKQGTIFPSLDLPFYVTGGERRG